MLKFVPSLVENVPVVLYKKTLKSFNNISFLFCNYLHFEKGEEEIFKSCQFIFIISQLSPLWEGHGPSIKQTWIPFTKEYFVPSLVEIGPVVQEKKIFKSCQFIFIISHLSIFGRAWPFIWTNLNPLHPGILCAKFG